ncbi:BTAD domain-containing putative transcriptional regulator [Streptomyces sp. NPDC001668]|uniref:AfsR/SARP family transcriptional regulator n=1 Tax=unclassified Streptomyces TaxID=2593676 RepID=UPI00367ECDB6
MRFHVLGPLRAEPRTPTAAKMRTVLGTLLVHADEVVSTDGLIDELWGDAPPRTALTTLHVYVSHLRKLLADDGVRRDETDGGQRDERIETKLPGYLMRTGPGELDLHRFETLYAKGHGAYARHDFAGAADALREALGLWTGPLLDGVPHGRRLEAAANRLETLRLDALEQRIAADLWLGRHRELVGELTVLAGEHPLRETLHAHLIVALYRSNRQSEALTVYDSLRRSLIRELGADPGTGLRELHQRVLRSEPIAHVEECRPGARAVTVRGTTRPEPVVRLPPRGPEPAGRGGELAAAEAMLRGTSTSPPVRVLHVLGPSGVGKTAFCLALAHRAAGLFPDGRVFMELRGSDGRPLDARRTLLRLLRLLRPGPSAPSPDPQADVDELSDLLRVTLSGRRLLLVLDDAGPQARLGPVLTALSAGAVVITGRRATAVVDGGMALTLDVLSPEACTELLVATAGKRVADDPAAAERIARLCGHLPLAVRAAGAALTARPHWSAATLAAHLDDERTRLEVLGIGDRGIRDRLFAGYRELAPEHRQAFRLLVLGPGADLPLWSAAALLGVDHAQAQRAVDELVQARLLSARPSSDGRRPVRYGYDELPRAMALALLADESDEPARAATLRLCAAYLALARYADARLAPGRGTVAPAARDVPEAAVCAAEWLGPEHPVGETPLRWFQEEGPAVVAVVQRASAAGAWPAVWMLAESLTGYLQVSGEWDQWEKVTELGLDAARRCGEPAVEAVLLCAQGELAWQRCRFTLAAVRFQLARHVARDAKDRRTEARALVGLADAEWGLGRSEEARSLFERACDLSRADGDLRGLCDASRGLGLANLRKGNLKRASWNFAECEKAADALGDRRWAEYARRTAADIRTALATGDRPHGGPLEVRPGMWAMDTTGIRPQQTAQ